MSYGARPAPAPAVVAWGAAVAIAILSGSRPSVFGNGRRFAAGLGGLGLVGSVAMVFAVTHVVGYVFGYLVVWAIAIPVAAFIGLAMLEFPLRKPSAAHRPLTSAPAARLALCLLGLLSCVVLVVRVSYIPSITAASNPEVARMYSLVAPSLQPDGTVFVGNNGAGTANTSLVDTEEFIGLVNALDEPASIPWSTTSGSRSSDLATSATGMTAGRSSSTPGPHSRPACPATSGGSETSPSSSSPTTDSRLSL